MKTRIGILELLVLVAAVMFAVDSAHASPRHKLRSKVVGRCAAQFDNTTAGLSQVAAIAEGETCVVKVWASKIVKRKGKRRTLRRPVAGLKVNLLRSDSFYDDFHDVSEGTTNGKGIVQLPFTWSNDACAFVVNPEKYAFESASIMIKNPSPKCGP